MLDEEVPRGTRPRVVAMRFNEAMIEAIVRGWKTETRRAFTDWNCQLSRGRFAALDLSSGRPDGLYPVSSLRVRVETGAGDRRSATVAPRIQPGAILWPRNGQEGEGARRENARAWLRVWQVQARRLCDLSEDEAHAEGIRVFSPESLNRYVDGIGPGNLREQIAGYAYGSLMTTLGKRHLKQWTRGPVHQDIVGRAPSGRDAFALLWEKINGPGSWGANPWVWRYVFRPTAPP